MNPLNTIKTKKILVIGDVMLDTYFSGDVRRISPEAPVPVFRKTAERSVLGGAANVAVNLVAAHQQVALMTVLGTDAAGDRVLQMLKHCGIDAALSEREARKTTVKTRFLAGNGQQMMRLDVEDTEEVKVEAMQPVLSKLEGCITDFDLLVVSDYMKGLLSFELTQRIIQIATEHGIRVLVDVKDTRIEKYKGAYLLKPNQAELHMLTGMPTDTKEEIVTASRWLREKCGCTYILTTCGAQGMILVGAESCQQFAATAREVFDVTGAGDTAIAYLAAALANDLPVEAAVRISNCAAGLQVAKIGTSIIDLSEVSDAYIDAKRSFTGKLLNSAAAVKLRAMNPDKCIVFTNGCFDILHVGHIRSLRQAADEGDLLVVGLNSDRSVRELKGEGRPINNEYDRAELLCSLEFVDYVVIFDESTPYELIKCVQPDVLAKGGDYRPEEVVGRDIVEGRGGKLVLLNYVEGKSTTNIIHHLQEEEK